MKQLEISDAVVRCFSAYHQEQDGTRLAEQVSPMQPKTKLDCGRIYSTIFLDIAAISEVAYCVRLLGPEYLRSLSISQISSMLRNIVRENYWRVARDWPDNKGGQLALDDDDINPVCLHFSRAIVSPQPIPFLFPLTSLKVDQAFEFENWSLLPPSGLARVLSGLVKPDRLNPTRMPLSADEGAGNRPVNSWLVIQSPKVEHAQKLKRIILGAIALCMLKRDRHQFSLRSNSDGYCYISEGLWTASSSPHMPPIGDIVLDFNDISWLHALSQILVSAHKNDVQKRNSLEYYYNAWFLTASERCTIFFSALEAIFGAEIGQATQGLRAGIMRAIPSIVDRERLKIITDLRNSLVHGGAPDAYSSKNYRKYYRNYKCDILDDIEFVTEICLRNHIFGETFREQPDPHAESISKYQNLGVLPILRHSNSIVS